jgi:AcrR family transcriptional regulator
VSAASADGKPSRGRHNRRGEVLDAAIAVFHEKGYASASIQDVADRVGVLKGSLYHYISSKEDLLVHVFEDSDRQSEELAAAVTAMPVPAIEKLRAFVYRWSLWHLVNMERATVYFKEWKHLDGPRQAEVKRKRRDYERFLIDLVVAVKSDGDAPAGLDARYACFFILSALNGLPTWYRRRSVAEAEYLAETYAEMAVGMVHAPAAAPAAA